MANNNWHAKFVVCPFYAREESQRIMHECLESNVAIHTTFSCQSEKRKWMDCYCDSNPEYMNCPIYQMYEKECEKDGE